MIATVAVAILGSAAVASANVYYGNGPVTGGMYKVQIPKGMSIVTFSGAWRNQCVNYVGPLGYHHSIPLMVPDSQGYVGAYCHGIQKDSKGLWHSWSPVKDFTQPAAKAIGWKIVDTPATTAAKKKAAARKAAAKKAAARAAVAKKAKTARLASYSKAVTVSNSTTLPNSTVPARDYLIKYPSSFEGVQAFAYVWHAACVDYVGPLGYHHRLDLSSHDRAKHTAHAFCGGVKKDKHGHWTSNETVVDFTMKAYKLAKGVKILGKPAPGATTAPATTAPATSAPAGSS